MSQFCAENGALGQADARRADWLAVLSV